jgi:hypothetical protein
LGVSSLESEDLILALNAPGASFDGNANLIPSLLLCSRIIGLLSHDIPTSESCAVPMSGQLMLFAEAFPVSRTRSLADDWAVPTSVTSGRNSPESFARLDRDGLWRKTCQGYSQVTLDGSLETFSETWPKAGMTRNGIAYLQVPSVPLIDVIGSGSWPTPRASEDSEYQYDQGHHDKPRLTLLGCVKAYPTPRSTDGTHGGRVTPRKSREGGNLIEHLSAEMWPTPNATDGIGGRIHHPSAHARRRVQISLNYAAKYWLTPTSRDWKDGSSVANVPVNALLGRAVAPTKIAGSLNPAFVEYLMGFPIGWTACAVSGTRLSRTLRSGSLVG